MKQNHNPFPVILLTAFALVIAGCSGYNTQPASATPETNSQQLPFTAPKPLVVPADTIIYVHLKQPLSAAEAEAGQDFQAVLDEPLLADNQIVASQGAAVGGKVVAARESGRLHTAGYVRIRLCSISINGKQRPLMTNSMIAAGGKTRTHSFSFLAAGNSFRDNNSDSKEAGFSPGQRLGFRLTQPLTINTN